MKSKGGNSTKPKDCDTGQKADSLKPLRGKSFYLHLTNYTGSKQYKGKLRNLKEDLIKHGARLEEFLSKDIKYLVTNQLTARECRDNDHSAVSTPSPFNLASPGVESPQTNSPAQGDAEKTLSRGKKIVQQAAKGSRGTSNILANAKKFGVRIIHISTVEKWLAEKGTMGETSKCKKVAKTQDDTPSKFRAEKKQLGGQSLKFEARNQHYKPVYKEFDTWPILNLASPGGTCPFDNEAIGAAPEPRAEGGQEQEEVDEQNTGGTPQRRGQGSGKAKAGTSDAMNTLVTAGELKRMKEAKRKADAKKGYCEMCKLHYNNIDKHVASKEHKRTYEDNQSPWRNLDLLISRGPNMDRFLRDVQDYHPLHLQEAQSSEGEEVELLTPEKRAPPAAGRTSKASNSQRPVAGKDAKSAETVSPAQTSTTKGKKALFKSKPASTAPKSGEQQGQSNLRSLKTKQLLEPVPVSEKASDPDLNIIEVEQVADLPQEVIDLGLEVVDLEESNERCGSVEGRTMRRTKEKLVKDKDKNQGLAQTDVNTVVCSEKSPFGQGVQSSSVQVHSQEIEDKVQKEVGNRGKTNDPDRLSLSRKRKRRSLETSINNTATEAVIPLPAGGVDDVDKAVTVSENIVTNGINQSTEVATKNNETVCDKSQSATPAFNASSPDAKKETADSKTGGKKTNSGNDIIVMHVTSTPISKETLPLPCRRTDLTGVGNKDKSVSLVSDPTTAAVVSPIKSTRGTGRKRKQAGVDLLVETEPAQSSANLSKKSVKSQRRTKGGTVVSPTKENEKPAGSKVKEGGVKKSKKLGKKEEMLNKRKVKLKKTWRVLSDRSMQKLFQSEIDGEDFAGFNDSNDAIPELPTDVSYVDLTEIEIDENSEIEWILTNYEAEKQDHYLRSLKMHINTSLDDINEPSDWADQCYHYLEDSIERGKKQQISQKNLMVIPPPERKSPRKSPIKSPVKMVTTRFPLRTTDPYRHEEGKTGIYQLLKEVCCLENIQLERRKMERQDVKRNEKARGSQNIGSDHGVVKGGNMVGKREKIKSNGFQTNRAKNQVASSTTVAVRCHQSQTSSVKMHGQSQSKANSRRNSVQGALKSHNTNESGVHKRGTDEESVQIIKVTRKNSTSKVILIEVPGSEVDSVEEKTDDIHLSIAKHVTPLDNGQIGQSDQIEGQSGGFEPASDHVDTLVESQGKGLEPSSEIIEFSPPPLNTSTPLRTEITSAPLQSGATRRVKKERLSRSRKSSRIEGASVRDEGEEENPSRLVTSGQNVTKTDNGQSVSTKRGKAARSKSHSSLLVTGEKQDEVIFKRRRRRSTSSVDSIASTIPEISAATAQHGNKVRRRSLEVKNKDVIDDAYDIHEEDFEIRFNYASPQRRRKAFCSLKATDPNVVISPRRSNSAMSKSRGSLKNSAMNRKRKSSGLKGRKLFAGKLSVTPSNGAETVRRNLQKNPLNVSKNSWGDDNCHTRQESTEKPRVYNYNVFQSKAFRRSVSMAFDTSVDQAEAQTPVKPDVGGRTSRRLCKTSPSKNAQSPNFGERKWKNWKYSMMVQGNISPSKTLKILSASPVKSPNTLRCREERSGKDCFASPSSCDISGERFLKNWKYAKMTQGSVSPTKSAKIISTSPNRLQRSPGKKRNSPQKRANSVRKHAFARADRDSVKRKLLTQANKEKCP